jgi:hypothetical protein
MMSLEREVAIFESLLGTISEGEVTRDPDGDYVLNYGGACFYARLIGEVHPIVQLFSVVATDIPAIPDLLVYINDVNCRISFVRTLHVLNQVLVEADFLASELSATLFHTVCRHIAEVSDEIGEGLVEIFDAKPRWQLGKQKNYAFGFSM